MKTWLRWLLYVLAGLLAVVLLGGWWLLATASGARFALGFVPGFAADGLSGSLAGPLVIEQLRLDAPAAAVQARRIEVDPRLWPLLSGRVVLDRVAVDGLRVQIHALPPPTEPAPPAGPPTLPDIVVKELALRDAEITGISADPLRIDRLDAIAQTAGPHVHLQTLTLVMPQGEVHAEADLDLGTWAGKLKASVKPALGPEPMGEVGLQFDSDGEVAQLSLLLPGDAGLLTARVEDLAGAMRFEAQLKSPGLELSRLGLPGTTPLPPIELSAKGDRSGAQLSGVVTYLNQAWKLDGTTLAWDAERLRLAPLAIERLAGGTIRAEGDLGLTDNRAQLQLLVNMLPLGPLAGDAAANLTVVESALTISGSVLDWTVAGPLHLIRDDNIELRIKLKARGNNARIALSETELLASFGEHPIGVLALAGELGIAPPHALTFETALSDFDTGALLADWPGRLSASIDVSGDLSERLQLQIGVLQGELRGAPIHGKGALSLPLATRVPVGALDFEWGRNQVTLEAEDGTPKIAFTLAQPELLDPGLAGSLRGTASFDPQARTLSIQAEGSDLAMASAQAKVATFKLVAALGAAADAPLSMQVDATGVAAGGRALDILTLRTTGRVDAHQIELDARNADARIALAAQGGWTDPRWTGQLTQWSITPLTEKVPESLRGQVWSLAQPVTLDVGPDSTQFSQACFRNGAAQLCLQGRYASAAESVFDFRLEAFPLDATRPLLEPSGVVLEGQLAGQGSLRLPPGGGPPTGEVTIAGKGVEVLLLTTDTPTRLKLEELVADLRPSASGELTAQVKVRIDRLGELKLDTGLGASPAVLAVDFHTLEAFDGLSESLLKPRGTLKGQLRRENGALSGQIKLSGFSAELPAAGLKLSDSNIVLSGAPDRVEVSGTLNSGAGPLTLAGSIDPAAGLAGLNIDITGERFLAANLPQAKVYISPKLTLRGSLVSSGSAAETPVAGSGTPARATAGVLRISGEVGVPEAIIDLARFEPAVGLSPDVVVIDQPLLEEAAPSPIRADVTVVLGENVQLRGFGLDGKIAGRLSVRERPGRPTTARGEIQVSGTYKAYGQDLTIERGKLLFANSGLDNPGLDIRAVRVVGAIKAGVQVRGSADYPELSVYSDPAMDQINTLSYLVLGRPASEASGGASGAAVQNAAQQLGGNLLAKSIGQKLGLEVGIEASAELGGASAFTVGKYLSPKLFVGYGRSLYEQLQLFIVRYKLSQRYEVEATSGREQKIGVNYRWER